LLTIGRSGEECEFSDDFAVHDILASRLIGAGGGLFEPCSHQSDYDSLASCFHPGVVRSLPDWLSRRWSRGWLQHLAWTRGTTGDRRVTVCIFLIARLIPAVCRFDACAHQVAG